MLSHDLLHTSNTTASAPMTNKVLWSNTTGNFTGWEAEIYSSPTVYDGKVYVGTLSSYIYCFNEDTGETLWYKEFEKLDWGICGTPTLVNDRLYFGAEDKNIYCLDPNNGDIIWNYTTGGQVWSSAAVFNSRVHIGSLDRYLYCLDENTGDLIWKFETNPTPYGYQNYGVCSSPAISNGRLFFGACDGKCYSIPLDDPDGNGVINSSEIFWKFDTGCYVYASPTVFNGRVYIGTGTYKQAVEPAVYKLYCLDEKNGTKLWEYKAGSHFLSTPAIAYDKLYIGSLDGNLYCLPLEDPNANGIISEPEVIWKFNASNVIWSSPAVAEGRVYFSSGIPNWESGDGDYRVYCLPLNDPDNNGIISNDEIIWSYNLDGGALTSPAVVNNKLFVSTYDGKVYCFTDGAVLPKIKSISPENDTLNVPLDINITVEFSKPIDPATLTSTNLYILDEKLLKVPGEIIYNSTNKMVTFDPTEDLAEKMTYKVILSTNIQDLSGNGLDSDADGAFEPEEEYSWSFTTIIYPPEISKIPVQRPVEGEDWFLNMSFYVHDANTLFQDLIITENSSYAEVIGEFIVFNYPSGTIGEFINITVSDGTTTVWQHVKVEVKLINSPPVISPLPEVQAVEDVDKSIDLSKYVTDPDNELEELRVKINTSYARISGMVVTFNYPNGILSEIVNITVSDGLEIACQHVKVNITPVNDAPIITGIPDQQAIEDIVLILNVTEYIYDVDNTIAELEVSTNSDYAVVEKTGIDRNTAFYINFNYPNGILYEKLNLTVTDGDKFASREIEVVITPVNDPPMADTIPEQIALEDVDFQLNLSEFVNDIDTPIDNLSLLVNSKYLIKTEGWVLTFNYPEGMTEDKVNISIEDDVYKCYIEFKIKIIPVNDQPKLYNEKVSPEKGDTDTIFYFSVTYWDIDGKNLQKVELVIEGMVYEMKLENFNGNGSKEVNYTYTLKLTGGTYSYYFQCDDNSGQPNCTYATENATIMVTEISDMALSTDVIILGLSCVIIIIVLIFVFLMIKRRRVDEGESSGSASMLSKPKKEGSKSSKRRKKKVRNR